ncbi:hypothetical protein L6R52_36205 [Myxococcota bacterium]|nr:hypothetical protein [Myxococcota bacterium]
MTRAPPAPRRARFTRAFAVGAALAVASAVAAACVRDETDPPIFIPPPEVEPPTCTVPLAGLDAAQERAFEYLHLREDCVLDPVGRAGSCNVGGCDVSNVIALLASDDELEDYATCTGGPVASGVDYTSKRVLVVRQGMRVGETMSVQPVAWVADVDEGLRIGEKRQSFCTGGQPLTGGVISYAVLVPIPTSSTATVSRHICFRRTRCDCSEEESC